MPWGADQQTDVLEHIRWLIARRVERASLRRGQLARVPVTLTAGAQSEVGALARWNEREATILIYNNGETAAQYTIDPQRLPAASEASWGAIEGAEAWLLAPDGITPLTSAEALGLSGTLPPLSATMILLQAKRPE
jgi:hypothetical protein